MLRDGMTTLGMLAAWLSMPLALAFARPAPATPVIRDIQPVTFSAYGSCAARTGGRTR
jgi:hypothetical protein